MTCPTSRFWWCGSAPHKKGNPAQQNAGDPGSMPEPEIVPMKGEEEDGRMSKLPLDDNFCKSMDAMGLQAWERILQEMENGQMESVCAMNQRDGIREEKWSNLDMKHLKFPPPKSEAMKATMVQHFEADFARHLGIISPAAAISAKATMSTVKRDLALYRRRHFETLEKD